MFSCGGKWAVVLASTLMLNGCANPTPHTESKPTQGVRAPGPDSVIELRRRAPPNPIIRVRTEFTILLSMPDAEAYYAQWPLSPEVARFREEIRQQHARHGRAELAESQLADMLAARLMESGRAAVRQSPGGRLLPWVRSVLERDEQGASVVRHRAFFAPDGRLILRVLDGVTVS